MNNYQDLVNNENNELQYYNVCSSRVSEPDNVCSLGEIETGGGIVFLLYPYIGLIASAYVTIPVVAPIAFSGFYSYNDMSFMEVMKRKIHFMFKNKVLLYESTESESRIKEYEMKNNKIKDNKTKNKKDI